MASFNIIFTVSCLLALIFQYGIMSTEGRLLEKTETKKKCENHVATYEVGKDSGADRVNPGRNILEHGAYDEKTSSVVHHVPAQTTVIPHPPPAVFGNFWAQSDDFRPTQPGNSPGAGHSKGPSSEGPN